MSHTGIVFSHCWVSGTLMFLWRRTLICSIFWDRLAVIIQTCITCNVLCPLYLPPSPSPPFTDLIIMLLKGFSFSSPSHLLSLKYILTFTIALGFTYWPASDLLYVSYYVIMSLALVHWCSGRNFTPPCSQVCLFALNILTGYFIIKNMCS